MDIISSRYAESLFAIAKDEDQVKAYQEDMNKVHTVFSTDQAFVQFFSHVSIQDDVKLDLLDKDFNGQVSFYVLNFLKLLVKKRRFNHINDICRSFEDYCNDYFGIKVGKVYSPFPIEDKELQEIEEAMSKKENTTVKLKYVEDSSLIGGIKVVIENHVYDDSIVSKLETLKKELLRK